MLISGIRAEKRSRRAPETALRPKPCLNVVGRWLLWHVALVWSGLLAGLEGLRRRWVVARERQGTRVMRAKRATAPCSRLIAPLWRRTPFCRGRILVALQANASGGFREEDGAMAGEGSEHLTCAAAAPASPGACSPTAFSRSYFVGYVAIWPLKVCLLH